MSDEVKAHVVGLGFDPAWIESIIVRFGPAVLNMIADGISAGFSKQFITDTLEKLGPLVLGWLITLMNKKGVAATEDAVDVAMAEQLVAKHGTDWLAKFLAK